jgi:hypothetical protein
LERKSILQLKSNNLLEMNYLLSINSIHESLNFMVSHAPTKKIARRYTTLELLLNELFEVRHCCFSRTNFSCYINMILHKFIILDCDSVMVNDQVI